MIRYGWLCEIFRALLEVEPQAANPNLESRVHPDADPNLNSHKAGGSQKLRKDCFETALKTMIDVTAQEPVTPAMLTRLWASMLGTGKAAAGKDEEVRKASLQVQILFEIQCTGP